MSSANDLTIRTIAYDEVELLSYRAQGSAHHPLVAELVEDDPQAASPLHEVGDGPGVGPGQKVIEVSELWIELVIFLGTNSDDLVRKDLLETRGGAEGLGIAQGLGVAEAMRRQEWLLLR